MLSRQPALDGGLTTSIHNQSDELLGPVYEGPLNKQQ